VQQEYGIDVVNNLPEGIFEAAVLAVSHKEFECFDIRSYLVSNGVLFDVKGLLPKGVADARL
jgi:UDP-N-acetyl-D-galactosamine dehydrogenase